MPLSLRDPNRLHDGLMLRVPPSVRRAAAAARANAARARAARAPLRLPARVRWQGIGGESILVRRPGEARCSVLGAFFECGPGCESAPAVNRPRL